MTRHFDVLPDLAIRPSAPISTVVRFTPMNFRPYIVFSPHTPYASSIVMSFVGEQRHGEIVLVRKRSSARTGSAETPEDRGAGLAEGLRQSRKIHRFLGATRGIGPRIEIEDELLSREICERNFGAFFVGELEGGGLFALCQTVCHMPSFRRFQRLNLPLRTPPWGEGGRTIKRVRSTQPVNQSGDVSGAGDTDKGMSDPA